MRRINPDRTFKSMNVGIYFGYLTDEEIQNMILACQEELELRSQEHMATPGKVGEV